jgi:lipopolysaccharide export system protein LptA
MIKRSVFTLGLLLVATSALALKSDRDQEILVAADRSSGTIDSTELFGNVQIDQGTLKIRAEHAKVDQADGETERVVFDGSPATLQQAMDEDKGLLSGEAKKIDYLVKDKKVILTGGVVINRPRGTIKGERIVYFLDTGFVDAGVPGGRVHMTIKPKPKTATAAPTTPPTPDPH